MNALHFYKPELLWLLPLTLLPFISHGIKTFKFPGLEDWPHDLSANWLRWGVRSVASLTMACLVVAAAAPFTEGGTASRVGEGAEIVIVLDRSGSMSEGLKNHDDDTNGLFLSKIEAARKVLLKFMQQRPADTFGVVAFNAAPISVAPLSADRELAEAALLSAQSQSSGFTALGRALALSLDYFEGRPYTATRLILLVSDGDALIEQQDQETLKALFKRQRAQLIWIYVRGKRGLSIYDTVIAGDRIIDGKLSQQEEAAANKQQTESMHGVFEQLGIPYQAFEIDSEGGLQNAVAAVGRANNKPTRYEYRLPQQDYGVYFYILSMFLLSGLFWIKHLEITAWKPSHQPHSMNV